MIIPEGIVEFVPEFDTLIREISEMLAGSKTEEFNALPDWAAKKEFIRKGLTAESYKVFDILPETIQKQLFLERDPHGNVQVSLIESEKLFAELVKNKLDERKRPAHTREASRRSSTSSDMREDAHSRQTLTRTTATAWATMHSC